MRIIEDYEGKMAKAQLKKIESYAKKLNDMIMEGDELEAWVQAKLSVVAAYMGDIKHYLDYELESTGEVLEKDDVDEMFSQDVNEMGNEQDDIRYKVSPSSFSDDMLEAKQVVGAEIWDAMSTKEKIAKTRELKNMGIVGHMGEQEDVETFSAMQYYARGGNIRKIKEGDKYKHGWGRITDAVGEFDIVVNENGKRRMWYGTLYELDSIDKQYWSNIRLKPEEKLFRYSTYNTEIVGMRPVVKINIERGIIYFLKDLHSDDDKNLQFETKGIKLKYLTLNENVWN